MFSKSLGGIEQVFLDYTHALRMQNFNVIPVIHPKSQVKRYIDGKYHSIHNFSQFDLFAVSKIRRLVKEEQPKCIITHGNRAATLFRKAKTGVPIIAVCHNYKYKALIGCDAIIAITCDLKNYLIKAGQESSTIYIVPNMIHISEQDYYSAPTMHNPPIIGAIGRFVKKKGFDVFIKALHELKSRGLSFNAVIAGDGVERNYLQRLANNLGLQKELQFIGWVEDKEQFFNDIDIFCLPSNHEPFGLVLLEAMKYCKPVITTNTEGPSEIIDESSALITPVGDYKLMASAIERLLSEQELIKNLSVTAFKKVQNYSVLNVSRQLKRVIEVVCFNKILSQ